MKSKWEYKTLGEVCLSKSRIDKASKKYVQNDAIQYIDIASIDNEKNEITSLNTMRMCEAPSRAQQCVKKNDVLVSLVRPNLRNVAIVPVSDNNLVASSGFSVLRAGSNVNSRYIFHYVCSEGFTNYLVGLTAGANYPAVRDDDVRNASIPVPPLDEQQRIVAELDLLTEVIDKRKMQLKDLDTLAQSIFYDMFSKNEESVPLSYYVGALSAGKSLAGDEICANKVLKTGAVTYDKFIASEVKNLPIDYKPDEQHKVCKGDVLISRMNTAELVGACAYVWDCPEHYYLPDRLWRAELKDNANGIFIWKTLISSKLKEQIRKIASGTSGTMKNISKPNLLKVSVPKVELNVQQEFADKIQSIEKQKTAINQSIADTQKLLDYTMDKYFG